MPRREPADTDCDSCGEEIDGFRVIVKRENMDSDSPLLDRNEDREEFPVGTAGYYRTNSDSQWSKFVPDEYEVVCDSCMENHKAQE